MATRGRIGLQLKDGSVLSAYHHWDSYCEWLGKILVEHYPTRDKVAELIDGGEAEALVYYNIDFSATSYWQSRDRMTTKDRLQSDVYWVFSKGGIEKKIYNTVIKKKDYTLRHFKRDLLSL